ncbi:hypothetical protein C0Q70_00846 [Pomacea canaliculata]|uniref:Cytosolic endo-beta-N-acetylglucosaminidase n=1 Tax=Pomacea canaliculata TaxID=400727 RepID=A0A2T7PXS9_POMCA|nr:cytosolic endo-beta-N-acetylglucosaminidase-like [Pomacea canaliculata]PVD38235.1 hypothetical protein C0Q70_00846 [Pomacea canaliculata]
MQHVTVPLKELFTRRKQNKPPNGTELHLQVHEGPWQMANVTSRTKGTTFCVDPETKQPECIGLKTLPEVLSWKPVADFMCNTTPCFSRPTTLCTKPSTLVCHDFKGGYLEDRYLQGGQKKNAYYFSRWECVDIFVYFSHDFITLPPLGWVLSAHKHGVLVLGTLITEWGTGAELWEEILSSESTSYQFISKLVSMSKHYGFDGWLLNIENNIQADKVPHLKEFVRRLTEESHISLPGSKILWYDSVTEAGDLMWQNELNENNSIFFDACDGIFLNYCWKLEGLTASKEKAVEKNRPYDVFVGIDVFGRGCPGGGGFNTREALQAARSMDLSAAVFAPGWVLETLGEENFDENDCRFWAQLSDLCYPSPKSGLPLATSFCQGQGESFFCLGEKVSDKPWYNMSLQQLQPERTCKEPYGHESITSLKSCLSSAYYGGCSLQLSASLDDHQLVSFRLFSFCEKLDQPLYCSYTYRDTGATPCKLHVVLGVESGHLTQHIIMGSVEEAGLDSGTQNVNSEPASTGTVGGRSDIYVQPLSSTELEALSSSIWFHGTQNDENGAAHEQWLTRYFKVSIAHLWQEEKARMDKEIVSVAVNLSMQSVTAAASPCKDQGTTKPESTEREERGKEQCSVVLGHFQIFKEEDLWLQPPIIKNITLDKLEDRQEFLKMENNGVSEMPAFSSPAGNSVSKDLYCILWEVQGKTVVDFFNVYFVQDDNKLSLAGQSATPALVVTITPQQFKEGKIVVMIQPVLSCTALPLPSSKCHSETLFLNSS